MEKERLPDLEIIKHSFAVSKLNSWKDVPKGDFVFVSRTDSEISLVCPEKMTPKNTSAREDGWSMIRVVGQLDFSLTGILSGISSVLADELIPIFAVSTYDTDYILIKNHDFDRASESLKAAGYILK